MSMPLVRIHGIDDVRLDKVDTPSPGPNDVLVSVALCGICGSDIGYIGMGGLGMTQPMPLGHELVGTVAEVGVNVSQWQPGQRVVVNPMAAGNSIGNGGPEGGFAPLLLVRNVAGQSGALFAIPDQIGDEQAALVEPLSVALHGCHRGRVTAGATAVVFGAGPIGLCTLACLNYLGVDSLVSVDVSDFRLEAARKLGAVPFNPTSGDLPEFLTEQHGAADLMGMTVPATDLYFEASGAQPVFEQIVGTARTGARLVILGLHKQPVSVDLANVLLRELEIIGSMAYPTEFPEVIEMLVAGHVDTEALVSHRFPLSRFTEALTRARDGSGATKVMVDCQT